MKKNTYVLIGLLFSSFTAFGQKTFIENGKLNGILPVNESNQIVYQVTGKVDSTDEKTLYKRAKTWIVKTYTTPKDVIQVSDIETGQLVVKGFFLAKMSYSIITTNVHVSHKILIEIKPNRYRITISDFYIDEPNQQAPIDNIMGASKKLYTTLFGSVDDRVNVLIGSFQRAVSTVDDF